MNETCLLKHPLALPYLVAILVVGIAAVFANGILLIVLLFDPLKCFRRPSMYFITSLGFSDLLTGIVSCLYSIHHIQNCSSKETTRNESEYLSKVIKSTIWASVENSFITVLLMAIERYIFIKFPIKAKSIVTVKRIFLAIGVTWLVSLIFGAGVSLSHPYDKYIKFGILFQLVFLIFVMLFLYVRIIILLGKSSKAFQGKQFSRHCSIRSGKAQMENQHQSFLNKIVFYLALILFITVLPHLIIGQIFLVFEIFFRSYAKPKALEYASFISFPLELLNFVLNAVVYAYRLPKFRSSLCHILRGIRGKVSSQRSRYMYEPSNFSIRVSTKEETVA